MDALRGVGTGSLQIENVKTTQVLFNFLTVGLSF